MMLLLKIQNKLYYLLFFNLGLGWGACGYKTDLHLTVSESDSGK